MMKERVHPRDSDSPPNSGGMHRQMLSQDSLMSKDSYATGPPSGTYVIQVPKDQVYRLPPPENAHKYKLYTTRPSRRSRCRCCCCALLGLLVLVLALLAAALGVLYLVLHPQAPSFAVSRVSVEGLNVTASAASSVRVSPAFNVTVRAENPNGKIGVHYELGSKVRVYHGDVMLCSGVLPAFYQPAGNVTAFSTRLGGGEIVLSNAAREQLVAEEKKGEVPLVMKVRLPVSVSVGSLKTWTMTAKGECTVVLSGLTAKAKLISKDCRISVKVW